MAWFRKKQKEKCIHHWHYVSNIDSLFLADNGCLLFCPKCEKESAVSRGRWEQLHQIQKIRESYQQLTHMKELGIAVITD